MVQKNQHGCSGENLDQMGPWGRGRYKRLFVADHYTKTKMPGEPRKSLLTEAEAYHPA